MIKAQHTLVTLFAVPAPSLYKGLHVIAQASNKQPACGQARSGDCGQASLADELCQKYGLTRDSWLWARCRLHLKHAFELIARWQVLALPGNAHTAQLPQHVAVSRLLRCLPGSSRSTRARLLFCLLDHTSCGQHSRIEEDPAELRKIQPDCIVHLLLAI
jgi:hypothetical protein